MIIFYDGIAITNEFKIINDNHSRRTPKSSKVPVNFTILSSDMFTAANIIKR